MAKLSFADGFDGFDGEIDRPCRVLLTTPAQTCRVVMFCAGSRECRAISPISLPSVLGLQGWVQGPNWTRLEWALGRVDSS